MTRLLNAALIMVFTFFVALGVFWPFSGHGTRAGRGGDAVATAVAPHWQPDFANDMLLDVTVYNPSSQAARITAASYEVQVDGKPIGGATGQPLAGFSGNLPAQGNGTAEVTVTLPPDFVMSWWPDYVAGGEASDLRIQGVLSVERGGGDHDVPFEWRSQWHGALADQLSQAAANCGQVDGMVCLQGSVFFWEDGALHATAMIHNPGSEAVALGNATVALLFGERAVVEDTFAADQQVPPGGDASLSVVLNFSPPAIQSWWPDHVARCERTPVTLRMYVEASEVGPGGAASQPATLQWVFPAALFQTRFVCDG